MAGDWNAGKSFLSKGLSRSGKRKEKKPSWEGCRDPGRGAARGPDFLVAMTTEAAFL